MQNEEGLYIDLQYPNQKCMA